MITEKEFWEWCDWEYMGVTNSATHGLVYAPRDTWRHLYKAETTVLSPTTGKPRVIPASYETFYAEKKDGCLPITLDNLFKYAVPKLDKHLALELLGHWVFSVLSVKAAHEDPAQALYQAICKVIEGEK